MRPIFYLFFLLALTARAQTQLPDVVCLNEGWEFVRDSSINSKTNWTQVNLPHTWNVDDVMDDVPGYYRGVAWYRKRIFIPATSAGKILSVYFEGVNQEATVFINGKLAGKHSGGYSGFSIGITEHLHFGKYNEILVQADNSANQGIAPLSADFTFYGGIYRDVFLISSKPIHFSSTDHGSTGVYVQTPHVSQDSAEVHLRSLLSNDMGHPEKVKLTAILLSPGGNEIIRSAITQTLAKRCDQQELELSLLLSSPMLWSPDSPNLYRLITIITNGTGEEVGRQVTSVGFRWFKFDPNLGFFLNGKPLKLVGTSRHQDFPGLGNAVPDTLAVKDLVLLKNMGGNFLRVAHYPQDPCILKACDSLGLLASVEIPIVNEITESKDFSDNCKNMLTEMIRQNMNHPSVILWCYMNEVLLRPHYNNDKPRQDLYFENVRQLAQSLEDLARKEDPYRWTMMANHGNLAMYKKAGLLSIPMVIGWNLYSGWYGGNIKEFPAFLDDFHHNYPDRPMLVTEYGADADPRIRSMQPERFDKSVEYTVRFHQFYLSEMMKRTFVAGAMIWNLADFNSETRNETMPHMNNKGLLDWDRTPKDPYYLYQAMLLKKPYIKLLGLCAQKFAIADSTSTSCYQTIDVATNLDSIQLWVNGSQYEKRGVDGNLASWKVQFRNGSNKLMVEGWKNQVRAMDTAETTVFLQPPCLKDARLPFREMNIAMGSHRFFTDKNGNWWQPDQPYSNGGWGSVGGSPFKLQNNTRLPYGTDKNILGTDDDPIYQTQSNGIRQYRFDLSNGEYELTFHFAELNGGVVEVPPYNLPGGKRTEDSTNRIFNVMINGKTVLQNFDLGSYTAATPVVRTSRVTVNEAEGIVIEFQAVEGEPVLNALQIKKIN